MKVSLEYELFSFFASVALAVLIGIIYDFFKAIRSCIKMSVLWDICMWASISFLVVCTWFFAFGGQLRWYGFFGVILTGVIYFLTVSKYVYFFFRFCVDKICLVFRVILKILLTPLRFLCKIISVYVGRVGSKFSKKDEGKYEEKKA